MPSPSPSSSLATLRPDLAATLEEFDLAADRQGFIGHRVLPVIEVDAAAGTYGVIPLEQLLQTRETRRTNGGYSRGEWTFDDAAYITQEHGHEEPVSDKYSKIYAAYFNSEMIAAQRAYDIVLRNAELRAANLLFNAATFTPTPVTVEWSVAATCTPMTDIEAAIQRVWNRCGIWPNTLVINKKVFRNLRHAASIIDRLKYSGRDDVKADNITASMLAELFGIDNVLVAGSAQNTANVGQTAAISSIWSDEYAMVTRVEDGMDMATPCIGRTVHWGEDGSSVGGTIETYRDETVRSDIVRVRHQTQEKLTYADCGELLSNITA